MQCRPFLFVALLVFTPLAALSDTPSLEVNVSRNQIYLGESLLLQVKVGGADNPEAPDVSAIRNGIPQLLGSQSSSHYSLIIVNGTMRKEGFTGRTFTYKVTPAAAGEMAMGPITATVAGQTLTATGPTVTVTGVTRQETVSVSVTASRDTVLVDEPFDLRVAVRIRRLPGSFANADPIFPNEPPHLESEFLNAKEIDGLKGPDYQRLLNDRLTQRNQPGFTINNYTVQADLFDFSAMMNPQGVPARFKLERQGARENGKEYWEYALTLPFSPLSEGSYTFGPVLFKGKVPVSINSAGEATGDSVFAVGSAAIVRVIPPPETNRPDSYIGAIGSNLVVEAALDTQTCNVGDPLKLMLTLSGSIQMRNITPPKLNLQNTLMDHFEVYDETIQTAKQDTQCRYTYTLRPRQAGSFELPPIEVSFYDVKAREYRTVKTAPIPMKVRHVEEITAAQVIGGSTNEAINLHREDESIMRPAGIRWTSVGAEPTPLLGSSARLIGMAAVGPCIFCLALSWRLFRRHSQAFREAQRRRRAFPRAKTALKSGSSSDRCGVLRRYLSDRFSVRTDSMTPSEALTLLSARGIPARLAQRFSDQMQHLFNATFETSSSSTPVESSDLESTLSEIERHLKSAPKNTGARGALVVLFLFLTLPHGYASTPAERAFIWNEAATEMSSANKPAEFLAAAGAFQKLIDLGVRNSDLFYNQGTALLLSDKPNDAIEVLLRAERYGGSAPDIRRNLAIAQARKDGQKAPTTSWLRLVLFWHYGLNCATRAGLAASAFSGLWLAWTLLGFGASLTGKTLRLISVVLLVAFGSSTLATLQQESRIHRPAAFIPPDHSITR